MKTKTGMVFFMVLALALAACGSESKPAESSESVQEQSEPESVAESEIESKPTADITETAEAAPPAEETETTLSTEETEPETQAEKSIDEKAEQIIQQMSLEDKISQLFVVLPEALVPGVECVTAAGPATEEAINEYPVGGIIYLLKNLQSEDQVVSMLKGAQDFSLARTGLPLFLCVDEEGGQVTRVAMSGITDAPEFDYMSEVGARGDVSEAEEIGASIGRYLGRLGFNVDFAPDADVLTNPENQVVKFRAFSSDPQVVADMASAVSKGLRGEGVLSSYKHFPGHGNTSGDTHEGYAYTEKTLEELYEVELVPFIKGIEEEVPFMMVGHISLPNVTGSDIPASLSGVIVKDLLRDELGYEGIIITDALAMGAVAEQYSSGEAAVLALEAGNDMILMPVDFHAAYAGVLDAVNEGRISEERIDESLMRIIKTKLECVE